MKTRYLVFVILSFVGFFPLIGQASEATDAVQQVAASRMSTVARINMQTVPVIYVGSFGGCDSVAIQHGAERFEHFRVCGNQVEPRNTVSPSWSEADGGRAVLAAVVENAILYGSATQTDANGYAISARTLGGIQSDCKNVEVVISYDGDLVDRAVKRICADHR